MPFVRRRPLLRAAAVGGVAYMGAKAGTNRAMQAQGAQAAAGSRPGARPGTGTRTGGRRRHLAARPSWPRSTTPVP